MAIQETDSTPTFGVAIAGAGIAGLTAAVALTRFLPPNVEIAKFEGDETRRTRRKYCNKPQRVTVDVQAGHRSSVG